MRIPGIFVFLIGIVIATLSTLPYLYVMVANTDPMMSRPTLQILLFMAGGIVGLLCLVTGIVLDRTNRQERRAHRVVR